MSVFSMPGTSLGDPVGGTGERRWSAFWDIRHFNKTEQTKLFSLLYSTNSAQLSWDWGWAWQTVFLQKSILSLQKKTDLVFRYSETSMNTKIFVITTKRSSKQQK